MQSKNLERKRSHRVDFLIHSPSDVDDLADVVDVPPPDAPVLHFLLSENYSD